MSINDVVRAIRRVQPQVLRFDPNPGSDNYNYHAYANNHETSTKYMIVDPLLRSLGWDLSNPRQCIVECPTRDDQSNPPRVDYALRDANGSPVILIEAKRIDVLLDLNQGNANDDQLLDYLDDVSRAEVGAVTNGQYWNIWVLNKSGSWQREGRKPLGLHCHEIGETAERLYTHLARENYW